MCEFKQMPGQAAHTKATTRAAVGWEGGGSANMPSIDYVTSLPFMVYCKSWGKSELLSFGIAVRRAVDGWYLNEAQQE